MIDLTVSEERLGEMLGAKLRRLRAERNMTMCEAAQMIGISQAALSNYETGKKLPGYIYLRKLAAAYDVSYDYLLGDTELKHNEQTDAAECMQLSSGAMDGIFSSYTKWSANEKIDQLAHQMMNLFFEKGGCELFEETAQLYLLCEEYLSGDKDFEGISNMERIIQIFSEKYGQALYPSSEGSVVDQQLTSVIDHFGFIIKEISGFFTRVERVFHIISPEELSLCDPMLEEKKTDAYVMLTLFGRDKVRFACEMAEKDEG